jgi:MFS family permease
MSCAFQPSYGKIYTLFPSKFVFLAALLIFEVGSVVCATAPSSHIFILGRALAGMGSAGIQAGTTLILAECVPLRQRPTWNSIIGSSFAVGSVAGPLLVFAYLFLTSISLQRLMTGAGRSLLRLGFMALVLLHQSPPWRRGHDLHLLFLRQYSRWQESIRVDQFLQSNCTLRLRWYNYLRSSNYMSSPGILMGWNKICMGKPPCHIPIDNRWSPLLLLCPHRILEER